MPTPLRHTRHTRGLALTGALTLFAAVSAGAQPVAPTPSWIVFGQSGAHYGRAVAGAGDVNDDGFADLLIGGPFYANY